jgi:hypothetical protein
MFPSAEHRSLCCEPAHKAPACGATPLPDARATAPYRQVRIGSGPRSRGLIAFLCLSAAIQSTTLAQDLPFNNPDAIVEAYLVDRNLIEPLAAHLRRRLKEGNREQSLAAAEVLGRLYVKMLSEATDGATRRTIEQHARDLLERYPEAESFELRLDLAKATYLQAEDMVERHRLLMLTADERVEAERILLQVAPAFEELASKLQRRVESLEQRERAAREQDPDALREELATARRLRSLAYYYAGWSEYYTAFLTGNTRASRKALEHFGVILNAVPGRAASIERLPRDFLRYEHVARAAIGCALCASLLGDSVAAERWLDAVEEGEGVPASVADQIFTRRLIVGAAAQRWADIDLRVKRRLTPRPGESPPALTVLEARLLAVLALSSVRDSSLRPGLRTVAERLAQAALSRLIDAGEINHVLDLVRQFGTAPIGDRGFIVAYVRGLQAYEKAREAHRAMSNPEEPVADVALVNLYLEAADLLRASVASEDANKFEAEAVRARIREGLARFYAGEFVPAANAFEAAYSTAKAIESRRDALWFAVVALDRAVEEGRLSQIEARDRLATLYLREFPNTENAARLLLRQTRSDRLPDSAAVDVLLAVPRDSPIYEAARRQCARLLYALFRRASGTDRDFAALRFADVAEEVLRMEQARLLAPDATPSSSDATAMIARARQLAEALLSTSSPDVTRAQQALSFIATIQDRLGLDLSDLEAELEFRRLQIALARADAGGATRSMDRLRMLGGPFAVAADRLLYRRALDEWKAAPEDLRAARNVVLHGRRILEHVSASSVPRNDPSLVSLRDAVAAAACALARDSGDTALRDLAIRLDREQLDAGVRTATSLRRLGELLDAAGDPAGSLAAYEELLLASQQGSEAWFESRYHSIRLLLALDPPRGAEAFRQFEALYPDLGPEPWRSRFEGLRARFPARPLP